MKTKDLVRMGIPAGPCAEAAKQILQKAHTAKSSMRAVQDELGRVAASPAAFLDDARYAGLAQLLLEHAAAGRDVRPARRRCSVPNLGRQPRGDGACSR